VATDDDWLLGPTTGRSGGDEKLVLTPLTAEEDQAIQDERARAKALADSYRSRTPAWFGPRTAYYRSIQQPPDYRWARHPVLWLRWSLLRRKKGPYAPDFRDFLLTNIANRRSSPPRGRS
jgi:hypothetical protein